MNQKELRELEARCIQEEPPACRAGCPLNIDARGFCQEMAAGKLDAARVILERTMPLAGIVARLCEAPCEQYCIRKDLGGAVGIGNLERTCIGNTQSRGKILKLPSRPKSVSVIGGGPSGLTVAFDLAKKGYPVTVYHSDNEPGSWLCKLAADTLPPQVREEELSRLKELGVQFYPASSLDSALYTAITGDAVYVGQDDHLFPDLQQLLDTPDLRTFALPAAGKFSGGLCPQGHPFRLITDVFQGREAAISIDRFLQGASLTASRTEPRNGQTALFTQTKDISPVAPIHPADPNGYSVEEAGAEAARCIDCQCLECVRHCVYLVEYKGYPKAYARRVYNNSAIVKGVHQANTFINTCALCRQCEKLCPHDFSMADLCLQARQQMVKEKRMPPSAHWFGLEEMRSVQEKNNLVKHNVGTGTSKLLFFPGCQLTGIRPLQALRLYDLLLEIEPQTGIWLNCCGAPAHWSGRQEDFENANSRLRAIWSEMGHPRILTACSTCLQMFRNNLAEFQAESVWTLLAGKSIPLISSHPALALTDPCTSRDDESTRTAVRELLHRAGQPLAPLAMDGELTECCGFGGLMENGDPTIARKVVETRATQTDATMLTYCAMCRDRLAVTGKPVLYLLDLLFPETALPATVPPVSISERRVNRRTLQKLLLKRYPESEIPQPHDWEKLRLTISDEMAELLEKRKILADDIRQVLFQTELNGNGFVHGTDERCIGSSRLGEVTFWVEYRKEDNLYHVLRCWSHRMLINPNQ